VCALVIALLVSQGGDELEPHVGLFVFGALLGAQVPGEALNQSLDLGFGLAISIGRGFSYQRIPLPES
jgi:hypothetical protein